MKELSDFIYIIPFEIGIAFILLICFYGTGVLHLKKKNVERIVICLPIAWYVSMILISLIHHHTDMLICLIFLAIFAVCFSFALYLVNRKEENEDRTFIVYIIAMIVLLHFYFFIF